MFYPKLYWTSRRNVSSGSDRELAIFYWVCDEETHVLTWHCLQHSTGDTWYPIYVLYFEELNITTQDTSKWAFTGTHCTRHWREGCSAKDGCTSKDVLQSTSASNLPLRQPQGLYKGKSTFLAVRVNEWSVGWHWIRWLRIHSETNHRSLVVFLTIFPPF